MELVLGSGGHGAVHVRASRRAGGPRNIARLPCCACAALEFAAAPARRRGDRPKRPPPPTAPLPHPPRAPRADATLFVALPPSAAPGSRPDLGSCASSLQLNIVMWTLWRPFTPFGYKGRYNTYTYIK